MCVYAIQFPAKSTTVHYVKIIVWYLAKTYITIAVYYFIREIRKEAEIESGFRDLDDYELKQFENGEEYSISRSNVDNMQMKPFLDRIQYVKYKEEEFEISLLELQLELCAFGNIQNFLKSQRGTFVDLNDEEENSATIISHIAIPLNTDEDLISTKDLSPLPWRWLALETIVDMCFSTQSDIWSYGVTLWELFQLGETPWQGYNFGLDFVKELKHGKRMKKPTYANSAIYQMMLNCWDECPQKRPTFQKLSEDFKAIFLELNCKHLPTNGVLRWGSLVGAICGESFMLIHLLIEVTNHFGFWLKSYNEAPFEYYLRLFLWTTYGSQVFISFALYILLFKAAGKKSISLLKIYIGGSTVNILVILITTWSYAIYFPVNLPNARYTLITVDATFKAYVIYCVKRFISELKNEANIATGFRDLSDYELLEFEKGKEDESNQNQRRYENVKKSNKINDKDKQWLLEKVLYAKYRKEDFEISLDVLEIDWSIPLGCGAYGTVYRALLKRKLEAEELPVAVKTTNPLFSNAEHFKVLLSELKMMTFIGDHENIVNLIGACTESIQQRKLFIVVELCAFGSLQTYLRSQRGRFLDLIEEPSSQNVSVALNLNNDDEEMMTTTKELVKWAKEIADGMYFLGTLKVIHGDLAARNVLLTEDRVAKITDFGLSRRLYNYDVYVKTQKVTYLMYGCINIVYKNILYRKLLMLLQNPIPWRWLALEAITDRIFSTHSDIWSYGVTLWEVFQLGEVPWPGYKFCIDFVKELKNGKRLSKPVYANASM
ncbi:unnamed protein product [Orchesella dallaii]|uniref:Protein kinase domain-containing protein n=1 Tax=Orchesella dallaii TaxID=48710 RepID=A0ABP1R026_9HEXA